MRKHIHLKATLWESSILFEQHFSCSAFQLDFLTGLLRRVGCHYSGICYTDLFFTFSCFCTVHSEMSRLVSFQTTSFHPWSNNFHLLRMSALSNLDLGWHIFSKCELNKYRLSTLEYSTLVRQSFKFLLLTFNMLF